MYLLQIYTILTFQNTLFGKMEIGNQEKEVVIKSFQECIYAVQGIEKDFF